MSDIELSVCACDLFENGAALIFIYYEHGNARYQHSYLLIFMKMAAGKEIKIDLLTKVIMIYAIHINFIIITTYMNFISEVVMISFPVMSTTVEARGWK